jgi:hypothetical protein
MKLIEAVRDETMMVPGYEDQTFECPDCHEVERRRVFREQKETAAAEPAPPAAASPESSTPAASAAPPPASPPAAAAEPEKMVPLHQSPPASPEAEPVEEVDEGEEMLRRAIAMVRSPVGGSQPVRGLTDGVRTPAALPSSVKAKKAGSGRRVQIRHDPSYDAAYAAKDLKTGLVVLRHQDSARLRSMCDRLGWQVVEDGSVVED